MRTSKIAISIDTTILRKLDRLVKAREFPNRSKAFQGAIEEKLARLDRTRLARECAKLDPKFEGKLAEEGFSADMEKWPKY